ncbi:MAG: ParB N-terminal domain-containing protein [Spirochaetes bacterium]|nr:ParB N-terminal domain-containing protein [Spirochaetota bacterium]
MKIKISEIKISERVRIDEGDIQSLAESIERLGLINPITITPDKKLLAGYRRLQAAKLLGWDEIECTVLHPQSEIEKLRIEAEENLTRKDFTDEEIRRYFEKKRYLEARGLEKFFLWFKRIFVRIWEFIKKLFRR